MFTKGISKEYKYRIEKVIDYILKNLNDDLSLEKLSGIANYSPYHFQKLFKQIIGETPKQYIIKLRLETAAHYLIIHPLKSITEISIDTGFSSPAVFARSFKNYFGISADELRLLPQNERALIRKNANGYLKDTVRHNKYLEKKEIKIEVRSLPDMSGIFVNAAFEDRVQIYHSIKEIIKLAHSHSLSSYNSKVMGVMYPHHNIYKAFVSIHKLASLPEKINKTEIKSGKYATFKLHGSIQDSFQKVSFFYNSWLPENGYKIADIYALEFFLEDPLTKPYNQLAREIYIPIMPA